MALDPSIPLNVRPVGPITNPLDIMAGINQVRLQRQQAEENRQQIEVRNRALKDQDALDRAVKPGLSLDAILQQLPGHLHAGVRKQWMEADEANQKVIKARADASAAEADYFGSLAASVLSYEKDGPEAVMNAAQMALQRAKADGHDTKQIEGVLQQNPGALPQILQSLVQGSKTQRELLDKERGTGAQVQTAGVTVDRWNTEKPGVQQNQAITARNAAASQLGAAPSKEAYAAAYAQLPPTVAAAFPPPAAWNPQTSALVQRIGMTADQQADNTATAARDAEAKRHNRATEANAAAVAARSEPLEAVIKDGKSVLVPRSQAVGLTPATSRERTTEDERKSVGWYKQMRDAAITIDQLEGQLTQQELYQIQTLPHEELIGMANRNALSEAAKRYFRAFTQFSEARLRSVSGAAISSGEYQSDRQTYGKQFGETPNLAADRKRAREVVIESTRERAGVAMPKEAGADAAPAAAVPPAVSSALSGQKDGRYTLSDGSVWVVEGGKVKGKG